MPHLKFLYGQNIQPPTDTKHPGFVLSVTQGILHQTICAHELSKKTFQYFLVTSDIDRDSFVGSVTMPILFKHDVNTKPGFLEVVIPNQPDCKRLREYVFDRLKLELNDCQGRPIFFSRR